MYTEIPVYESYVDAFQHHHEEIYSDADTPFYVYDEAYRYGYHLADEHRERDWEEFVDQAKADWGKEHGDTPWDDVKDAVRHAWSEVKSSLGADEG